MSSIAVGQVVWVPMPGDPGGAPRPSVVLRDCGDHEYWLWFATKRDWDETRVSIASVPGGSRFAASMRLTDTSYFYAPDEKHRTIHKVRVPSPPREMRRAPLWLQAKLGSWFVHEFTGV